MQKKAFGRKKHTVSYVTIHNAIKLIQCYRQASQPPVYTFERGGTGYRGDICESGRLQNGKRGKMNAEAYSDAHVMCRQFRP